MKTDWERTLAISRHLLRARPVRDGPPIQAGLHETLRRIATAGEGYCGDYVPVFMALAIAAGMPVRSWAFSVDGFGGHGHIWVEVWNRDLHRWQLVDIYNNVYFHAGDGVALSAAEFRKALPEAPRSMQRALLYDGAQPGYPFEDKMWAYYRRGAPEWYMVWGNNVFSYDVGIAARFFGGVSLSLEQLVAIAVGDYPAVKLLADASNRKQVDALWRLRQHVLLAISAGGLGALILLVSAIGCLRARRRPSSGPVA